AALPAASAGFAGLHGLAPSLGWSRFSGSGAAPLGLGVPGLHPGPSLGPGHHPRRSSASLGLRAKPGLVLPDHGAGAGAYQEGFLVLSFPRHDPANRRQP